jgi:hypothetical protein
VHFAGCQRYFVCQQLPCAACADLINHRNLFSAPGLQARPYIELLLHFVASIMSSQRPVLYVDLMSQPSRAVVIFCRWAIESLRLCLGQPVWQRGPVEIPKLGRKAAEVAFQMRRRRVSAMSRAICVYAGFAALTQRSARSKLQRRSSSHRSTWQSTLSASCLACRCSWNDARCSWNDALCNVSVHGSPCANLDHLRGEMPASYLMVCFNKCT